MSAISPIETFRIRWLNGTMIVRDAEIDAVILRLCRRQAKVAWVNLSTVLEFETKGIRVGEERVAQRIRTLIKRRRLKAFGDINFWGWSEIKAI